MFRIYAYNFEENTKHSFINFFSFNELDQVDCMILKYIIFIILLNNFNSISKVL